MKKLDATELQKLKARLEGLPPRQALRPYDVIAQLADTFSGAQARGYDIDDLIAVLSDAGITLARSTVRNYLSRAVAARRNIGTTITQHTGQHAPTKQRSNTLGESDISSAPPAVSPLGREQVLELARERARERRESSPGVDESRPTGSFKLVPDTKDL